jgi:hypothetical protein
MMGIEGGGLDKLIWLKSIVFGYSVDNHGFLEINYLPVVLGVLYIIIKLLCK